MKFLKTRSINLSYKTRFTIYFAFFFALSIALLTQFADISLQTIIFTSSAIIISYVISLFFIHKDFIVPVDNLSRLSLGLNENADKDFNNLDLEINKISKMLSDIESYSGDQHFNKEVQGLKEQMEYIGNRISADLQTAKIFKVNRNEFLGNVAHELRTPIFAIQLSLETLLDGALNDETVNEDFIRRAFNQTLRLKQLADDLVSISRLETGMKMSKRYFRINDMIRNTIDELDGIAQTSHVKIVFNTNNSNGVSVFGDEERIKQVMVNLIDNSIKYCNSDGKISIETSVKPKEVMITVQDNGIGIPQKDQPRIFERFYRVDKTRSRDVGGSGLGLSIVKHILEAHSSSIKVESETDKGTKFEFNLSR
ncbi:hypothetical protein BH10BAC5_BH10BAC5_29280 [soil metagenome]